MGSWNGRPYLAILGGKEEDRFTYYLSELLKDHDLLAAFIHKFLKSASGRSFQTDPGMTARIQVTVPGGRPDLAVRASLLYLLFEAKIGSWLHEDQLLPYAKELEAWKGENSSGEAALFLLVPESQVRSALEESERQLGKSSQKNWFPTAISWERLADFLALQAEGVDDKHLALHLLNFKDLVTFRLGELSRPFTTEETDLLRDSLVANSLQRTSAIMNTVVQGLGSHGVTVTSGSSKSFEYIGYNLSYNKRGWWYGVWFPAWARIGVSPVFLQLVGFTNKAVTALPHQLPGPQLYQDGSTQNQLVPLAHREGVDLDTLASEHTQTIWRYMTEVPESGANLAL